MATSGGSSSTSSSSNQTPPPPPKILLAKPTSLVSTSDTPSTSTGAKPPTAATAAGTVVLRPSRNPSQHGIGSLNLFSSDSFDFNIDRVLPFLTENTDFNVIGIVGPCGVGKSTILNELYGFDGSSPGMLPPFSIQSDETKALAKHCTVGVELRVSSERLVLLDAQPMFSPSVLTDMMRPDGSSSISVLNGEALSADLAHELLGIQLAMFLASICNVLLVVSEGVRDFNMWKLMLTVDLLKHGIPDPSILYTQSSTTVLDKENRTSSREDHFAAPVFIHTKLNNRDLSSSTMSLMKKNLSNYFKPSSWNNKQSKDSNTFSVNVDGSGLTVPDLFLLPINSDRMPLFGSYNAMLGQLRDHILSMDGQSFASNVTERDWLRNSAKIWELIKKSPVILDYSRTLRKSGLFRR